MKTETALIGFLLAAASASTLADQQDTADMIAAYQAAADVNYAAMLAKIDAENDAAMDRIVTVCSCVNGMPVYRQTTLRKWLAEGKVLAMKARVLELFVSAPMAMRLLSSCS
ncbi:hypothetical protein ACI2UC_03425 [Ralstonia nicotianae]